MSRVSGCRFHAGGLIRSSVQVSTLLLFGSAVFGQNFYGRTDPAKSIPWNSSSVRIQVTETRDSNPNVVTLQTLQHAVPKKADKEVKKAEAARRKNNFEDAIKHYNQAISIDPEFVGARNNIAVVYLLTKRPEAAIAQLEEAIKTDSKRPDLFSNLALGYAMIHRSAAAEQAARAAIDLDRADALPRLLLGVALAAQHKSSDEALQCFEQVRNDYAVAHFFAARILMTEGQLQRAKSEIQIYLASGEAKSNRELASQWLEFIDKQGYKSVASMK